MTGTAPPSKRSSSFKKRYAQLPPVVQREADEAYRLFKTNPDHPGLGFKQIVGAYYSARVGIGHRALAIRRDGYWLWFWIGSHSEYDKFLDELRRGKHRT